MFTLNQLLVAYIYIQGFIQGGISPHFFYLPIKVKCLQKSHIILEKQSEFSIFASQQNSSESDSTASKSTSSSCGPSMAIIISFDSEEG